MAIRDKDMHPSIFAGESAHRPRRVPRKRERRASCSSASSPSLSYSIPSLSKMERRSSLSSRPSLPLVPSRSTHSKMDRRNSSNSTTSLSDSFSSACSVKSCTFREDAEVIHIPSVIEDPKDLWLQKEDFDNFREKTRRIIRNVDKNGRGKNGKKYCTRGLEKYMAHAQESRRNVRKSILKALDEDETASVSGFSKNSVEEALELAETDARTAGSFYKRYLPWGRKGTEQPEIDIF